MNIFKKFIASKGDFNEFHNNVAAFLCIPFGSNKREVAETFKSSTVIEKGNGVKVTRSDSGINYEVHYIYSTSLLTSIIIRIWSLNSNLIKRYNELLNSIAQRPYLNYGDGGPLHRNMRYFVFEGVRLNVDISDSANAVDDDNYYIALTVATYSNHTPESLAEHPCPIKYVYAR
jgi:hypothetical protein